MHLKSLTSALAIAAVTVMCLPVSPAFAADDADAAARTAAEDRIESLMDDMELFYKVQKNNAGHKAYVVLFELGESTSKITVTLHRLGVYRGKPVFSMLSWTRVVSTEKKLPPAAIKLVATNNDDLLMGNYSTSDEFNQVYSNCGIAMHDTTAQADVFMCLAHTHHNSHVLRKEIDKILDSGF